MQSAHAKVMEIYTDTQGPCKKYENLSAHQDNF